MGKQEEINPEVVYNNLFKLYTNGDYEKALSNARKLARYDREDKVAQECIAVCSLQLGNFSDCLEVIEKKHLKLRFEKAYCHYRSNNTLESVKILESANDLEVREKELLAQIYYRLERFDDCISVYDDLIKNVHDEHDDERLCNYAAVLAAKEQSVKDKKFGAIARNIFTQTTSAAAVSYEMLYNQACGYAACDEFNKSLQLLESSISEFTQTNEDLSEDELNQELAVMRTQLAYVLQKQNKVLEALEVLNQVSKSTGDDPGIAAVVATNLITLTKSANVFENKRKLKTITAAGSKQKLSTVQKKLIDYNLCLFYLNNNQVDGCRKCIEQWTESGEEDSTLLALVKTALMLRDKKYRDAISYLDSYPHLELLLAQVHVQQGSLTSAVNILKNCSYKHCLVIVSALVSLYLSFEEIESAEEVISHFLQNSPQVSVQTKKIVIKGMADELISRQLYKKAIVYLEKLIQVTGPEPDLLAQLITCGSKIDPVLVQKYSKDLVSVEQLISQCDIVELSNSVEFFLTNKYSLKKAAKTAVSNGGGGQESVAVKKKTNRKKKAKLPKNFDPSHQPDPERWLPKWERSAFKKSRKKKNQYDVGKGTQGGTSGGSLYDHSGPKAPSVASSKQQSNNANQNTPESPKVNTGARPKTAQTKRRGGGGGKKR